MSDTSSMRTVVQSKGDQIQVIREALSKNPPGNSTQRKQLLKSGWRPNWRPTEKSASQSSVQAFGYSAVPTEESAAIALENEKVTERYSCIADETVQAIEDQISRFSIPESPLEVCPFCKKPLSESASGGPMFETVSRVLADRNDADTKQALNVMAREGMESSEEVA